MLTKSFERWMPPSSHHANRAQDKTVAGAMIDNLARKGRLSDADFQAIPFNTLHEWGP